MQIESIAVCDGLLQVCAGMKDTCWKVGSVMEVLVVWYKTVYHSQFYTRVIGRTQLLHCRLEGAMTLLFGSEGHATSDYESCAC